MDSRALTALGLMAVTALSGCFADDPWSLDGYMSYRPTGRTIALEMDVVDIEQEIYPSYDAAGNEVAGFRPKLWAFCVRPNNPNDAASVAAIEYQQRLELDSIQLDPLTGAVQDDPVGRQQCGVPGPTIRVRQGDNVVINFCNNHFHAHTIHWHGQYVPWEMDGAPGATQESVKTGSCKKYEFVAARAGTLWYHCHVDTDRHVGHGLYGAFIVEPQDESYEPGDIDREYILVLGTLRREELEGPLHAHGGGACGVSGTDGCQDPPSFGEVDTYLINGHSYPHTEKQEGTLMKIREGERIRIRLINTGDTLETMHLHGHDMLVTHRDGNPLHPNARIFVDTLTIGPAERYDVVVEGNNVGPWMFHTHIASHETNDGQSGGGMHTMLVYEEHIEEHGLHGFPNTLPGGQPVGTDLTIPGDLRITRNLVVPAPAPPATEGSVSMAFEVELPCAVRSVQVGALAKSPTPVLQALNDLTGSVATPGGGAPLESRADEGQYAEPQPLGAERVVLWDLPAEAVGTLAKGFYNVTVSGLSADAVATIDVTVDYWSSFEEATTSAHEHAYSTCPGYGG